MGEIEASIFKKTQELIDAGNEGLEKLTVKVRKLDPDAGGGEVTVVTNRATHHIRAVLFINKGSKSIPSPLPIIEQGIEPMQMATLYDQQTPKESVSACKYPDEKTVLVHRIGPSNDPTYLDPENPSIIVEQRVYEGLRLTLRSNGIVLKTLPDLPAVPSSK